MSDLIQGWIDQKSAQGGGIVTIPAGRYEVTKTIVLKSNIQLRGAGINQTFLDMVPKNSNGSSNSYLMLEIDRKSNVEISGMSIDGKKQGRPDKINDPYAHSISIAYTTDFKIENVNIVNSAGASIIMFNAENGIVQNNTITASGSNAILGMQNTKGIKVLNNTINGTDNQNGIFFMYQDGKSTSDIEIIGNTVKNVADYAIEVGHTTHLAEDPPHRNIIVKNNIIENAYCTGIGFRTVSDGVIVGNEIIGYAVTNDYGCNGIFIEGRRALQNNVTIHNNTIKQTYSKVPNQPFPYQQAIYITGMNNMEVTDNTIEDSWNDAIYVLAAFGFEETPDFPDGRRKYSNIHIENNEIINSEVYGVHFDDYASNGNSVKNNTILESGVAAILVEGDPNRVVVSGNITEGSPNNPDPAENLWTVTTNISPLNGYPLQVLPDPGIYQLTFDAISPDNGKMEAFTNDRRVFNKELSVPSQKTTFTYTFATFFDSGAEVVFHNIQGTINLSNITLYQLEGLEDCENNPNEPNTEFERDLEDLNTKFIALHSTEQSKAESLVELISDLLDLF